MLFAYLQLKKQKAFNDIILVSENRQNLTYSRMIGNKRSCSIVFVSNVITTYHTEREPLFYYLNKWVFGDTSETDMGCGLRFLVIVWLNTTILNQVIDKFML